MLKEGNKAPQFTLKDQSGKSVSLKDFLGKQVVLYFYPKDDTPGCTKEACNFRDDFDEIKKENAVILGVSADSEVRHKKFIEKYKLQFALLSDENKKVLEKYGVWQEKSMYGRKYMGIVRSTFIIDEKGKLKKIFPKVKVTNHNIEVLEALRS
ncbi:MAG: thioredoxin-dependent thiol peroxidase [Bacteroidetes bacterium]|nr:thioredoxin-dependent thiol peroxidase [Bacteroidota bacterium]MCH8169626.1 thioredoxin-dependent thiol peroxidase [Bacteroidota bacterium]MCH8941748.1 thioredoxin-dependent thiol peroxidase [Bacteroidota bacterium]